VYCTRCGTWTPDEGPTCARCGEPIAAARPVTASAAAVAAVAAPAATFAASLETVPRYGGFWRRFWATVVDSLVLFFPDAILRVSFGLPTIFSLRAARDDEMAALLTVLSISTALGWLYGAGLESSAAQGTLGQQLMNLRVCDTNLRRVTFARATARHFGQVFSTLLCGIGYLFNLWTTRRQALHDMLAGCVLVRPAGPVADGAVVRVGSAVS